MYSVNYLIFLILYVSINSINAKACTPKRTEPFYWSACQRPVRGCIHVNSVAIYQDGKSISELGGINMGKTIKLVIGMTNNCSKNEIPAHTFDITPWQYADYDGPCQWYILDVNGATDGLDPCTLINDKNKCKYKNRPRNVTVEINLSKLTGYDLSSVIMPGDYYAVEIKDFDGKTAMSCLRIQAKIIEN